MAEKYGRRHAGQGNNRGQAALVVSSFVTMKLRPKLFAKRAEPRLYGCARVAKGAVTALVSSYGATSGNWKIANVESKARFQARANRPTSARFLSGAAPPLAQPQPNHVLPVQHTRAIGCASMVIRPTGPITNRGYLA